MDFREVNSMRKIVLILFSLILIGCSTTKNKELNHDEIMRGDLSSIAGEYVNSEGHVIVLDAEKIKQMLLSEVTYTKAGGYFMNVSTDGGMFAIGLEILPVGVEGIVWQIYSNDILMKTDTSKIRIRYYNAEATSETEYYYKKD